MDFSVTTRCRIYASWVALTAFVIVWWLAGIDLPTGLQPGLDPSWQATLVDSFVHGRQFGKDIQFTYGPWGFVSLHFFVPGALGAKIAWETIGRLAMSVTLALLSLSLPGVRRWLFLAGAAVMACYFESSAMMFLTLLIVLWLLRQDSATWQRVLAIVWLSFFANHKFVFFAQAILGVSVAAGLAAVGGRRRAAIGIFCGYLAAYILCWVAAGQQIGNLPAFIRMSWDISDGYAWAMFIDAPQAALVAGLILSALCVVYLWFLWRSGERMAYRVSVILILAGGWLLAWKQAFTRADLHMFGYYIYTFPLALALAGLSLKSRIATYAAFGIALFCPFGAHTIDSSLMLNGAKAAYNCLSVVPQLWHLSKWRDNFIKTAANLGGDAALRSAVGEKTIDVLNFDQSVALTSHLNFDPRPVFQGYTAYTPALLDANASFYRSPGAPEMVRVRLDAIDGRHPAQDDSLVLVELLRRYELVQSTPEYALLKRRPEPPPPSAEREKLEYHVPRFGDVIAIPSGGGHPVWVEIECRPTILGRLRTFLYHSAELRMIATGDDDHSETYRTIPGAARRGLIIQPWLRSHLDIAALLHGESRSRVRSIRFEVDGALFWRRPRVTFYSLPDLAAR